MHLVPIDELVHRLEVVGIREEEQTIPGSVEAELIPSSYPHVSHFSIVPIPEEIKVTK